MVGTIGLFVGAASGIVRSTTPVLFSLVTGAQWFALGSSYYGETCTLVSFMKSQATNTSDRIKNCHHLRLGRRKQTHFVRQSEGQQSCWCLCRFCGRRTAYVFLSLSLELYLFANVLVLTTPGGPRNILPAIAVFSVFGASGQAIVNAISTGVAPDGKPKSSWLDSKWSPVTPMTDTEYATFIQDKILKLDVEMSMIDDQLAALRARKSQREAQEPRQEEPQER
jgi:hypothetical protein